MFSTIVGFIKTRFDNNYKESIKLVIDTDELIAFDRSAMFLLVISKNENLKVTRYKTIGNKLFFAGEAIFNIGKESLRAIIKNDIVCEKDTDHSKTSYTIYGKKFVISFTVDENTCRVTKQDIYLKDVCNV